MRKKSWGQYKKSFLDILLEKYRFLRVAKYINTDSEVLDLGCGYNGELLIYFSSKIKRGVGVDIYVTRKIKEKNITLLEGRVDRNITLKDSSFNVITALALIEHIENPHKILQEAYRLLKKDGVFLLTTPDKKSKPLLEFLAFKLGVISKHEIKDHKRYYSKKGLIDALVNAGFNKKEVEINTFEMGLNLVAKARK
ncbi:MAG: Methyltransferase type 11 [Candidatus Woesebacteria bacterium GW2011_GWA1_39_11b]|nr:MAG: Methyltransferase type 11 [Candidatus Woesebacteria bacterium GW2011_GWA1_39_11b]